MLVDSIGADHDKPWIPFTEQSDKHLVWIRQTSLIKRKHDPRFSTFFFFFFNLRHLCSCQKKLVQGLVHSWHPRHKSLKNRSPLTLNSKKLKIRKPVGLSVLVTKYKACLGWRELPNSLEQGVKWAFSSKSPQSLWLHVPTPPPPPQPPARIHCKSTYHPCREGIMQFLRPVATRLFPGR